jgi:hypothetical protein
VARQEPRPPNFLTVFLQGSRELQRHWAEAHGVEVHSIAAKKQAMRAVDVNPPVTVRARAASVAAGANEGRYRPIDIDRSPFRMENRRVNGALKVHGTLTCVSTQKLLCRLTLRRGVFPTPSRSRLGCERDGASGGCQSPGDGSCPPGPRRSGSARGTLPAD